MTKNLKSVINKIKQELGDGLITTTLSLDKVTLQIFFSETAWLQDHLVDTNRAVTTIQLTEDEMQEWNNVDGEAANDIFEHLNAEVMEDKKQSWLATKNSR